MAVAYVSCLHFLPFEVTMASATNWPTKKPGNYEKNQNAKCCSTISVNIPHDPEKLSVKCGFRKKSFIKNAKVCCCTHLKVMTDTLAAKMFGLTGHFTK